MTSRIPRWMLASTAGLLLNLAALAEDKPKGDGTAAVPPTPVKTLWFGDIDNDGRDDLFVVHADGSGRLLRNLADGRFSDVTDRLGIDNLNGVHMAAFADANADGMVDVYLPQWKGESRLMLQNEDGTFTDGTDNAGLPRFAEPLDVQWKDIDGDGHSDLWLTTLYDDLVYRNTGTGQFEKIDLGIEPREALLGALPESLEAARRAAGLPAIGPGGSGSGGFGPGAGGPGSQPICTIFIQDQANPSVCMMASSIPTLGMLYPISSNLFVHAGTGNVGINTTSPAQRLHVAGNARVDGQVVIQTIGAPLSVSSTALNTNLNADFLDGQNASAFATLPVDGGDITDGSIGAADLAPGSVGSSELQNGSIFNAHVNAAAAVDGTKINPDFGSQVVTTDGYLGVGTDQQLAFGTADVNVREAAGTDQAWISLEDEDANAPGTYIGTFLSSREGAFTGGQVGTETAHPMRFYTGLFAFMDADTAGMVHMWDNLDVDGDLNVDGVITNATTGVVAVVDQMNVGVGDNLPYQAKGIGTFGPTNGYLGVQGATDFDGETTLDISGGEIGVLGTSLGVSGPDNYGVLGHSNGVGVRGQYSPDPGNIGMLGTSSAGVVGFGTTIGIRGSGSINGVDATGGQFGLEAFGTSAGINVAVGPALDGIRSATDDSSGWGVFGDNNGGSGSARGVYGQTSSVSGHAVYASGNFAATGTKSFINPHPADPTKEIRFVCLEGNEAGTYFRGSARTIDGVAVIEVPEDFRLVSALEGMTVQTTPMGAPAQMWIESKDLNAVVVRSTADVEFDYFVNGVRRGFETIQTVHENTSFLPYEDEGVFGTQYPDAFRQILVENGILNEDFTPNVATTQMLEATLVEYAQRRQALREEAEVAAAQAELAELAKQGPVLDEIDTPVELPARTVVPLQERPTATSKR